MMIAYKLKHVVLMSINLKNIKKLEVLMNG